MELHCKGETNKYYLQRTHYTQHADVYMGYLTNESIDIILL